MNQCSPGRPWSMTVAAAQLLATNGFTAQAVACAFHAGFDAAEAALLVLGETRPTPAEVVSAFVQRVVRERSLDPEGGRLLRSLYNRCRQAEHPIDPVPAEEAAAAVRDAGVIVDMVVKWLDEPVRTPNGRVERRAAAVRPRRSKVTPQR